MNNNVGMVIKWSMAGWVFFIELLFFLFILILCEGESNSMLDNLLLNQQSNSFHDNIAIGIAIITIAGIPLGYIFYQIYYFFYWTIPVNTEKPKEEAYLKHIVKNCHYNKNTQESNSKPSLQEPYDQWVKHIAESGLIRFFCVFMYVVGWMMKKKKYRPAQRTVEEVISFRHDWSTMRAIWMEGLKNVSQKQTSSTEYPTSRFEYLTSMHDGLGSVQFANWVAGFTAILFWLLVLPGNGEWGKIIVFAFVLSAVIILLRRLKRIIAVAVWVLILVALLLISNLPSSTIDSSIVSFCKVFSFPVITLGIVSTLSRILWTNRIYLRLSVLMLFDNFLCKMNCEEPCRNQNEVTHLNADTTSECLSKSRFENYFQLIQKRENVLLVCRPGCDQAHR